MKNFRSPGLAALLLLAACSGGHHKPATAAQGLATLYCPPVAVLQQAQTLTLFLPGRQDVAARVSTAQITGVSGSCELEGKKNAVLVTVNTAFLADNGPANAGAALSLPWFAAITQGDTIVEKTDYTMQLGFDGNSSTTAGTGKTVKIELPNTPDSANMQILVGFAMTQGEQDYTAAHPSAAP